MLLLFLFKYVIVFKINNCFKLCVFAISINIFDVFFYHINFFSRCVMQIEIFHNYVFFVQKIFEIFF